MPKYKIQMQNGHELTIESPSWTEASEIALREHPGVPVVGVTYAEQQEAPPEAPQEVTE